MGSLTVEVHGWRGIRVSRDLFLYRLTIGFLSVGVCRLAISDRLNALRGELHKLKRRIDDEHGER